MSVKSFLNDITGPDDLVESDKVSVIKEAEEDFTMTFLAMGAIGGLSLLYSIYTVIGALN